MRKGKAMINEKMEELGRKKSSIREIFEYSKKRKKEIGEDNVFDFSIGNPSVPAPSEVKDALTELIASSDKSDVHAYTSAQGDREVRRSISDYINRRFSAYTDPELIYLTAGAAAALTISIKAITSPKDDNSVSEQEIIVLSPFFPEYKVFIEGAGAKMKQVSLMPPDFSLDLDAVEEAIGKNTAGIIVNSPNNPTGTILTAEEISALADILEKKEKEFGHDIFLISDEPYRELVYDGKELPYVTEYYNNSIVCYSYSKCLSLPGERIGYILVNPKATNAARLYNAIMGAGRTLGYVCAPSIFQFMLARCLDAKSDMSVYRKNRDLLYGHLTSVGFECARPSGAFYIFMKSPIPDAAEFCERAKAHELLFVPGDGFGCPGYVRIAYCTSTEMIERSLPGFTSLAEEFGLKTADCITQAKSCFENT